MERCWRTKLEGASLPRKAGGAGRARKTWFFPCLVLAWKLENVDVGTLVSRGLNFQVAEPMCLALVLDG